MIDYVQISNNNNNDWLLNVPKYYNTNITGLDAALFTIEQIKKNYPPPYTLCLSGGMDSQAMLYSWIKSGSNFNTFTAVYNDWLNKDDLQILEFVQSTYSLKINFVTLDLINFLFLNHENYATTYRCGSPHIITFMKFIELIDNGTVIFSGQPLISGSNRFSVDQNNFSLYKYALQTGKSVVPWFFLETPELAYGLKEPNYLGNDSSNEKYFKYLNNGFLVEHQPKRSGFETVKDYFDKNFSHLVKAQDKLIRTRYQTSNRVFDLLFRNKYEVKFSVDKYVIKYV